MMISQTTTQPIDLQAQLAKIGLRATAAGLDDLIARASRSRLSARDLLEEIARSEIAEKVERNLRRLLGQARIGRFRPMADFNWNWPKKIDRDLIERALSLDFIAEGRNLILMGANGLGKTMIAKNIAYSAVTAGQSVPQIPLGFLRHLGAGDLLQQGSRRKPGTGGARNQVIEAGGGRAKSYLEELGLKVNRLCRRLRDHHKPPIGESV